MILRRTKIIATLGPASDKEDVLEGMILAGMNVARLNLSHGTHEDHARRISMVRNLEHKLGRPIGILMDLQGPKLRIGSFAGNSVMLKTGNDFILTADPVEGSQERVFLDVPPAVISDIKPGDTILLRDGLIQLQVSRATDNNLICKVIDGGELFSRSGIHLPVTGTGMNALTDKDLKDLAFGLAQRIDMFAVSFVRTADDVLRIKEIIEDKGVNVPVIAKIEKREALDNFDAILQIADGIMVARGDLGIESDITKVPIEQKRIIAKCNRVGKPVITATQMLESMIWNLRPTRAEVTDVANAIFDGTDATMLSGETAIGEYPVECISMMHQIALSAESSFDHQRLRVEKMDLPVDTITEAIGEATAAMAADLKVPAVITFTSSGYTARMIAKFRPGAMVVAVTSVEATMRRLTLSWGIFPLRADQISNTDEMIANAVARTLAAGFVSEGDVVVITAGVPIGVTGTTNLIKVHKV